MDFAFSDEQEELRETLRRFLEEKAPLGATRALMESSSSHDPALWKQMASGLGLQGLHVPEAHGGGGFGFLELAIVLEELGRALYCGPYLSTVVLAANAVLNAGSEADREALLPGIAAGETLATLALTEEGRGWTPEEIALIAVPDGDRFRLSGVKTPVLDGQVANLFIVVARLPGTKGSEGLTLLSVRSDAAGLEVTALKSLDATRGQARLSFSDVGAEALGAPGTAGPPLHRTLDQAAVLLAAESAGGAARCLEMAVAYARERIQFGRAIGSFQAIKHKCADVLLEVESAKAAVYWAAWVAEQREGALGDAASIAKALASDAYLHAALENIQIHGGIGTTWEADPQLFLKRAKTNEVMLGDAVSHRLRLVASRGI